MDFGSKLSELRKEKNLSQKELGMHLGIPGKVVSFYETNRRFPQEKETLVKIADFFGVSTDWLLGRTEIKSFQSDDPNMLHIDVSGLPKDDINKIIEYTDMLKQKRKTP